MNHETNTMHEPIRRRRGFTLLEVMFAIMILGIGMIAVASLFPVAGSMQQAAFDDAMALQISTSAEAMLKSRPIPVDLNGTTWNNDGKVYMISDNDLNNATDPTVRWTLQDRSFPQNIADVNKRTYFWRPFYRWNDEQNQWEIYLIISKRPEGDTAPTEADYVKGRGSTPGGKAAFHLGETVINNNNGLIGTVTQAATTGGLSFQVNGANATEGDWWHVENFNGQPRTLDVLKFGVN